MESAETKTLRSAVRILEAPESHSIAHVTYSGPFDLRRDTLAVSCLNSTITSRALPDRSDPRTRHTRSFFLSFKIWS